jgi:hypothetical protein
MVEYRAIDALIILGGKTYLHIQTSIFLFCAYAQCIKRSIQLSSGTLDNPALLKYGVEVVDYMLFKVLCIFTITLYTSKSSLGIILLSV